MRQTSVMLAATLAALLLAAPASARPPNIVVLDICSARADRFGAYGSTAALTPGLDAFAADAALFERAWAQGSWCLPNQATLLTGLRPEAHGLHAAEPGGPAVKLTTLAERLRAAGYRTGGFTGGAFLQPAWGLSRGFDRYESALASAAARTEGLDALRPAIEGWLDQPSEKPFFLYATVDDLHAPYGGPGASTAALAGVAFFRAYNGEPGASDPAAAALRGDAAFLAELSARYDGAVRRMDRAVSAFLAELRRRGLWEHTLVVVTADHGEMLGEKGLLGHTERLYEPVLRVPLLVRHPRLRASRGARVRALVERADLTPTLLEAAGAPDRSLPGSSLLPLLRDPAAPRLRVLPARVRAA
jgi:arylsulfatase A-like enzyme